MRKIFLGLLSFLLFMCQEQEPSVPLKGKVNFGMEPAHANSAGRQKTIVVDGALVTIEKTSGEVVYEGSLLLTSFGESYISEQLELEEGEYQLTRFILTEAGVARYAAPLAGSPKASLVEKPLPLSFSIKVNEVTKLMPEVVVIGNDSPGLFGYIEFGFEIVDDIDDELADIHIVGSEGGRAMYWKNGVPTVLSQEPSNAKEVIVVNSDVYIVGNINSNAVYWKNGEPFFLPANYSGWNYNSFAEAITISGNDVYVAGNLEYQSGLSTYKKSGYWKNGELFVLVKNSLNYYGWSYVTDIEVEGNDVYVAGYETYFESSGTNSNPPILKPVYWKNGMNITLPSGAPPTTSYTYSTLVSKIKIVGTDVIAIGKNLGVYTHWKNDQITYSRPKADDGFFEVTSACVSNGKVYASGAKFINKGSKEYSTIWKENGIEETIIDEGVKYSYAWEITVIGTNFYTCGTSFYDSQGLLKRRATYWKNGKTTFLTDGTLVADANSIYAVKK